MRTIALLLSLLLVLSVTADSSAEPVLNIYSSRHYDSDDRLYELFTEKTGIRVNLIEGDTDALLTRLKREGRLSPADLFITVDAGRLHKAVEAGVLQPVESKTLTERIPAGLRHPEGLWFGLSQRVRCIFVHADAPAEYVSTYADLADPKLDDELLIRSSSNIYNQSLVASMIVHHGADGAQAWANGLVENMARQPQGGDTDQLRALAAGEGKVAVANHYYFARMITGNDEADRAAAANIRLVFPNQNGDGAHVNVSGAGVVEGAPNRANAIRFLEYMTTPEAQQLWALENYEYPVIKGLRLPDVLEEFGVPKADPLNAAKLGEHNRAAVQIMDRAGWR